MLLQLIAAVLFFYMQGAAWAQPAPTETVAAGLQFPEGTVFVGQDLFFTDYAASTVYRLGAGRAVPLWHQEGCGANGLLPLAGGLLVACYDSGAIVQISTEGQTLRTIARDGRGAGFDRPNDLARNSAGAVYFTASGSEGGAAGKVYYLPAGAAAPREVATGIQNANGVAVSPDGRLLYLGESSTDKILQFDIAEDGSLKNRRDFLVLDVALRGTPAPRHTPDGIRTDRQGRLFVSLYNGGGFAVFDPAGHLLFNVPVPGEHHANLALSPDGRMVFGTTTGAAGGSLYRVPNPAAP